MFASHSEVVVLTYIGFISTVVGRSTQSHLETERNHSNELRIWSEIDNTCWVSWIISNRKQELQVAGDECQYPSHSSECVA
jgi:hypothetical protein